MANRCHSGRRCQNAGIGAADESSAASDVKCTLHWAGPKTPRETGQTKASRENGNNCLELQTPLRHCCQQTHSASQPLLRLYLPWTTRRSSRHHQRFQLIVSTLHSSSSSRGTPHPRMEAVHISKLFWEHSPPLGRSFQMSFHFFSTFFILSPQLFCSVLFHSFPSVKYISLSPIGDYVPGIEV